MIDLVALQRFVHGRLSSFEPLNKATIMMEREFLVTAPTDPETGLIVLDYGELVLRKRNGVAGLGAMVEMPAIRQSKSLGPITQDLIEFKILFLEERNTNFTPGVGTFISAETAALLGRSAIRRFQICDIGEFFDADKPIEPAPKGMFQGLVGYYLTQLILVPAVTLPLLSVPAIAVDGAFEVSFTAPVETANALIYYTLDATFPGPSNPAALRYDAPFTVEAATVILWSAYATGYTPSDVDRVTINS